MNQEAVDKLVVALKDSSIDIIGNETCGLTGSEITLILSNHKSSFDLACTLTHECLHVAFPELEEPEIESIEKKIMRRPNWASIIYRRLSKELFQYASELSSTWKIERNEKKG